MSPTDEKIQQGENALAALENIRNLQSILATVRTTQMSNTFSLPKDEKILEVESIELSTEGGIFLFYKDCKFVRKGYPISPTVTAVDNVKKVLMGLAHGFSGFRGKLILLLFVGLFRKRVFASLRHLIEQLHYQILFHRLQEKWYCKAARQLYRAIDDEKIRDIAVMILEYDDSYRYRFQDVVGELNPIAFSANPLEEIDRLLALLQQREKDQRLKQTWKMSRKLLFFAFFFKGFREPLLNAFSRIDPQQVRMDESDSYFASLKVDGYNWGGKLST